MANKVIIFTTLLITTLILYLYGREVWCPAGDLVPWSFNIASEHTSQHLLDWYTPSHISHGLLFCLLLRSILPKRFYKYGISIAVVLESAWEILENSDFIINRYRTATIALNYFGDSISNSISDIAWCLLGYVLASKLAGRYVLLIFFSLELFTLYFIRDNLSLNILMLIWPIDAVKSWQIGR